MIGYITKCDKNEALKLLNTVAVKMCGDMSYSKDLLKQPFILKILLF
jgi:hypothetical protein